LGFITNPSEPPYQVDNKRTEILEIKKGLLPRGVSSLLKNHGIIGQSESFYWYGKIQGYWGHLKAGAYEFSPSMNADQIFELLVSGISVTHPFLVREGENSYEIAHDLELKGLGSEKEFLKRVQDPSFIHETTLGEPWPETLEGFLFPDTYLIPYHATEEEIIEMMIKRFQKAWTPEFDMAAKERNLNRNQLITLASIVEKETGAPEERPLIAGVFYNRLNKHMRLQSDPTTIYGMWDHYHGNITKKDLQEETPYNTYTIPALPKGPICNPGLEAIVGTLHPGSHSYFFFVSNNNGTHTFTETYGDHRKAVSKTQLDPKAKEGKSWRDLSKKLKAEKKKKTQ